MIGLRMFPFVLAFVSCSASGADYFIATDGTDGVESAGTIGSPWASLSFALPKLVPGDVLNIRGGRYFDEVVDPKLSLSGTPDAPITIRAYGGEAVTFDGTVPVAGPWEVHSGSVYKTQVPQPMWQLFAGGELMVNARWPNARHDDGTIHTAESWAEGYKTNSTNGYMAVDPLHHDLAAAGIDATGAIIVANVKNWITYTCKVTHHEPGTNEFNYTLAKDYLTGGHRRFYLEASLALLDQSTEWHLNNATKTLYFFSPDGKAPGGEVRGRVQNYALDVAEWENVRLEGIDFFSTTFRFQKSSNVTVFTSNLYAAGASKRPLGEFGRRATPSVTFFGGRDCSLVNSSVRYSESQSTRFAGTGMLIENCLLEFNDWAAAEGYFPYNTVSLNGNGWMRHNTIRKCGSSETLGVAGRKDVARVEISFTDVTDTGYAQSDGGLISIGTGGVRGSVVHHNWLHDARKSGLRFDGPNPPVRWGVNGTTYNNVIWKCGGSIPKGDEHRHLYNTILNNSRGRNNLIVLDETKDWTMPYFANSNSTVANCAVDSMSGHRRYLRPVMAHQVTNYDASYVNVTQTSRLMAKFTDTPVMDLLRDYEDRDFRPANGSVALVDAGTPGLFPDIPDNVVGSAPDIGAYEFGATHYWIPGRAEWKASKPIPSDGRAFLPPDRDLIWHGAYRATAHTVHFGEFPDALKPLVTVTDDTNVVVPTITGMAAGALEEGTYYWRVDAVVGGETMRGDLWSFSVGAPAPRPRPTKTPSSSLSTSVTQSATGAPSLSFSPACSVSVSSSASDTSALSVGVSPTGSVSASVSASASASASAAVTASNSVRQTPTPSSFDRSTLAPTLQPAASSSGSSAAGSSLAASSVVPSSAAMSKASSHGPGQPVSSHSASSNSPSAADSGGSGSRRGGITNAPRPSSSSSATPDPQTDAPASVIPVTVAPQAGRGTTSSPVFGGSPIVLPLVISLAAAAAIAAVTLAGCLVYRRRRHGVNRGGPGGLLLAGEEMLEFAKGNFDENGADFDFDPEEFFPPSLLSHSSQPSCRRPGPEERLGPVLLGDI